MDVLISRWCECLPCDGDPVVLACAPVPPSQPQTPTPSPTGPPWPRRWSSSATSWPTLRPPPSRTPRWPSRTVGSLKVCVVCIHRLRPTANCQDLPFCAPFRILLPVITFLGHQEEEEPAPTAKKAKGPAKTKEEQQVLAALKNIKSYTAPLDTPWCRCSTVSSHLATVYTCLHSSNSRGKDENARTGVPDRVRTGGCPADGNPDRARTYPGQEGSPPVLRDCPPVRSLSGHPVRPFLADTLPGPL